MAGSSEKTAKAKRKQRGPGRPFQPGQSGNPAGRPKGFGGLIREKTRNGEELVEFALAVLRADVEKLAPADVKDIADSKVRVEAMLACVPELKHRLEANEWLSDQGWGKAPVRDEKDDLSDVPESELVEALAKDDRLMEQLIAERARLKAAAQQPTGGVQ